MPGSVSVGQETKSIIESMLSSGFSSQDVLKDLDSYDIEWYIMEQGDLMVRSWQVAAEGLLSPEQAGEIRAVRAEPKDAVALEWVSRHLVDLRAQYPDRWIAVSGNQVVASADTLPELLHAAQNAGVQEPFITQVPAGLPVWTITYHGRQDI
jgi:hypothetical protein